MFYSDFKGKKISLLGFGTMRLPMKDGEIDEEAAAKMTDTAIKNGLNYFDTAFPYHAGKSEIVMGKILAKYPRESFYLATKFPGHQPSESYSPAEVFEKQLKKCQTDYFDFYLLHNVYEKSVEVYENPKWGIIDYLAEQKRLGRIKHLGFSTHARPETLEKFLEKHADLMEFCQIQLNCLDITLQEADKKLEILKKYNIPVWVMEPLRGGKLSSLDEKSEKELKALRPGESISSWSFRWLMRFPEVKVILSGMSDGAQMEDNLKTFSCGGPLSDTEAAALEKIADGMKNSLPCTACRYCCDGCPKKLDIPKLISAYNDAKFSPEKGLTSSMYIDSLPESKRPSSCIGCGRCERVCPQNIKISEAMADFNKLIKTQMPDWNAICRQRALDEKKLRNE